MIARGRVGPGRPLRGSTVCGGVVQDGGCVLSSLTLSPTNKRSLGTANDGAVGRWVLLCRKGECFSRDSQASWIIFREGKIGIFVSGKRDSLCNPSAPSLERSFNSSSL